VSVAEFKVVYRPRADATAEREVSALVDAYRFIIFDCRHETEKGAQPGAVDAAKESANGCDATRILPL
jgi:hypothetical protein